MCTSKTCSKTGNQFASHTIASLRALPRSRSRRPSSRPWRPIGPGAKETLKKAKFWKQGFEAKMMFKSQNNTVDHPKIIQKQTSSNFRASTAQQVLCFFLCIVLRSPSFLLFLLVFACAIARSTSIILVTLIFLTTPVISAVVILRCRSHCMETSWNIRHPKDPTNIDEYMIENNKIPCISLIVFALLITWQTRSVHEVSHIFINHIAL